MFGKRNVRAHARVEIRCQCRRLGEPSSTAAQPIEGACLWMLQGGPGSLPLYTEEWVEELLARVFSILANLEAPQTRSDHAAVQGNASAPASDSASFLLEGNSMFRYLDSEMHETPKKENTAKASRKMKERGRSGINAALWSNYGSKALASLCCESCPSHACPRCLQQRAVNSCR